MSANFTPRTQEVLSLSKKLASKFLHSHVLSEHVLLSLIKIDSFLLPYIEYKLDISFYDVEQTLIKALSELNTSKDDQSKVSFSGEVKSFIDLSYEVSSSRQHSYVSVEHLFYAMLNDVNCSAIDYLVECDIDIFEIQKTLDEMLSQETPINTSPGYDTDYSTSRESTAPHSIQNPTSSAIDTYGVNLNNLAKQGKYNHISPNKLYINQIEEILCRKTKSCVLLVGDAGVGKTALVEGLSNNIVQLKSTDYLLNKTIISLDLPGMIAGTKYRGQFEERLKAFIDEAKSHKHIVLFIDEIHTIVGAGNSEGSLDAANILKPYISSGEITCIGSTTHGEYKKTIAKDSALKRRFSLVKVIEPSFKEALNLINHLIPSYSIFHGVNYEESAIVEAINLSINFIHNKQLPDKAIDLLDQAGSSLKLNFYKKPKIARQMEHAFLNEDLDTETKSSIYENYKSLLNKWSEKKVKNPPKVQKKHIRQIISKNFDIPIESLNEEYSSKLLKLEERMCKDVIGQTEAISLLCNSLFKTHCGLKDVNRPIGSFLFLGKTGVGKTITSKSLAKHYFGSSKKLIYFDMSEFSESNSVSKFSGSSPGYVGYEEGGILTEKIKRDPHSVLLFDEIEKAHPIVLQSLLQILEEGRMTDNSGEETCFKNVIIILTSNLGSDIIDKNGSVGFLPSAQSNSSKIINEAKSKLSPELVNRFDGIVVFNNFSEDQLKKIINIEIGKVRKKLKLKNIKIKIGNNVKKYILSKTIDENLGGRPIRRIIQNELEVCIAKYIVQNSATSINVNFFKGEMICSNEE